MGRLKRDFVSVSQDEIGELWDDCRKCKCCGKPIWYKNIKLSFREDGKPSSEFRGTTHKTIKTIDGVTYTLNVCQNCLEDKFPDFKDRNLHRIFNTFNKYVQFAFDIPEDVIKKKNKETVPTLENCIRKHGEEKGREIFEEYKRKQAYTNSFEYKQAKHGWTKEQFDEYNKSRAVTYENLISRHGKKEGERIWKEYKERQSYTSTNEYLKETYGEYECETIQLLRAKDRDGFIRRYGKDVGEEKYNEFITSSQGKIYSDFSKKFFDELCEYMASGIDYTFLYADCEYCMISKQTNKLYSYDFFVPEAGFVIELNGDYWHCNPKIYDADYYHQIREMSAKEIWKIDADRKRVVEEEFGHKLIVVWESDIVNDKKLVIEEIVKEFKKCISK